jgi:hypothetical protein
MKNLLHQQATEEILQRIDKISPASKALWGKMNVNQSLRHMSMSLQIPIGELDPTVANVPKMPKWLLKFFLLNANPPKGGAETFKEINTVANNINPTNTEEEKRALKDMVTRFTSASNLIPENKLVGKFTRDNWGKLNYNHLNHHLSQFGA